MAKLLSILFLSLVPAHATVLNRPWLADMGLNAWPMLQAHDAATGYLEADGLIENILYRFTKTQYGNASSQLDCGIRAFDWRPNLQNETLGFAHGAVFINHSMLAAAEEVVAWANAHASEAEDGLVLLIVADCNGQACWDAATAAFSNAGLPVLAGDSGCATASGFTLSAAMAAAALPGGGHALALMNCPSAPVQTYDDRCSCTGFFNITEGYEYEADVSNCLSLTNPQELQDCLLVIAGTLDESAHFACYNGHEGRNSSYPFDRLLEFNSGVAAVPLPSAPGQQGLLASLQVGFGLPVPSVTGSD